MMWFPKRDDDNTPQGKMAYGCMCMIWFAIAIIIFIGVSQIVICELTGYCEGYTQHERP